ncbi:MAG: YgiQ family radical SAM protein, partial [Candidatus Eisenbacteria sp.]|nr:YgiQ family radical SAM protein [Candidatus Eisenbacteria bacterium]
GNVDSILSNYTGNAKVRERDPYSPDGNPYFGDVRSKTSRRRPDRATIRYANLARAAYRDVPLVLGGLEASLRRFVHYDYQQSKLRASVLADAKADLLVFGMGERASLEIARSLAQRIEPTGIAGTCERLSDGQKNERTFTRSPLVLSSWDDIQADVGNFMKAELSVDRHARARSTTPLLQRQQSMWVLQNQPAIPLSTTELDRLYALPFTRRPHPSAGKIPAYRTIQHSITIVRGCFGNCSFCSIARHQGPSVTSRSRDSVLEEVRRLVDMQGFSGTISDLGGPTANLYGATCGRSKPCRKHDCLYPTVCPDLRVNESSFLDLLENVARVKGVKHVYVSSGLRMELLMRTPRLLSLLLKSHTPGAMKIAPEHTERELLRLMHKGSPGLLSRFVETCRVMASKQKRSVHFTPYFISAHPGCTLKDMEGLVAKVKQTGLSVRRFQDFTPTPGTVSTAMYVTGMDRDTLAPIHVPRGAAERMAQRKVLEAILPKPRRSSLPKPRRSGRRKPR